MYDIIDKRRRETRNTGDLLSSLLVARDEETGEGLTNMQLRDEVMTIFLAGHETTALALTWAWYFVSLNSDVERRLHEELVTVLGDRIPTVEDLPNLIYTTMVIKESLRLCPPAWAIPRTAFSDDEIGGYHVPAKCAVLVSPYVAHRHSSFWDKPNEFDPERFLPERCIGRPRFAYFPFGGGSHQCIGSDFAMLEMQLIVAMVARGYRLHMVPGQRVKPYPMLAIRPRRGLMMTVHEQSSFKISGDLPAFRFTG